MRARVMVAALSDRHESWNEIIGIADEYTLEAVGMDGMEKGARERFGDDLDSLGLIDIEIPDDVIRQVTRRRADAGTVEATAVEE